MKRIRLVLGLAFVSPVVLLGILYAGDGLLVRYRMTHRVDRDPFDQVTYYIATPLKNGRVEVFYDQPQTACCVRALFPRRGSPRCGSAARHTVRHVSFFTIGSARGLT